MEKRENKLQKFIKERREKIVAAYLRGIIVEKIAAREGVSKARVYQILKREGVELTNFATKKTSRKVSNTTQSIMKDRGERFVSMYNSGMTMQQIGDIENISRERVRQILKRAGFVKRENIVRITAEEREEKKLQNKINNFWSKVNKTDGCWLYTGALYPSGYGHNNWNKKDKYAHRIAWILTNGEIPDGLCVLHKCDNPPCCNPDHLYLGTMKDNAADRELRGRGGRLKNIKTVCKRGHPMIEENLSFYTQNGKERRFCKACSTLRNKEYYSKKKSAPVASVEPVEASHAESNS